MTPRGSLELVAELGLDVAVFASAGGRAPLPPPQPAIARSAAATRIANFREAATGTPVPVRAPHIVKPPSEFRPWPRPMAAGPQESTIVRDQERGTRRRVTSRPEPARSRGSSYALLGLGG